MEIWVVDAFTSKPFSGNPAAVCIMHAYPEDRVLQQIAMEMNLSETAFLVKNAVLDYHLRWFTPTTEVNLCGHATLAATHVLRQSGLIGSGDKVTYRTASKDLYARVLDNDIELDFPELSGTPVTPHSALQALGVEMVSCERNRDNYLVEVKNYEILLACSPDFKTLTQMDMQGVIVTTATGVQGFDFASRYFGPNCGVDEDPVTGSAHCFLAPFWAKKLNRRSFHALQASKRQGVLDVVLEQARVLIAGKAVTTLKGQLQMPLSLMEHAA
jgi:predicted PhzF superfamily epimerase YddE/YHI9